MRRWLMEVELLLPAKASVFFINEGVVFIGEKIILLLGDLHLQQQGGKIVVSGNNVPTSIL